MRLLFDQNLSPRLVRLVSDVYQRFIAVERFHAREEAAFLALS